MGDTWRGLTLSYGGELRASLPETPLTPGLGGSVEVGGVVTGFSKNNGIDLYVSGSPDYVGGMRVGKTIGLGGRIAEKFELSLGNLDDFRGVSFEYAIHVGPIGLSLTVPEDMYSFNGWGVGGAIGSGLYIGYGPKITALSGDVVNEIRKVGDAFNLDKCFLAGTMIDMWPIEAGLKPNTNGFYHEAEVRQKVWQKPIEEVTANDWVLSFDNGGRLKPGRVKRTFENEAKIILDFHGVFVTPAHVYYCAGGAYEGKFVPLIDILRDDGVVQYQDGTLIRAATGCEVGSEDDKPFWAFLLYEDEHGMERIREKRQLRLGTRWMMPDGKHFSMREYMEGCGIELIESGELEGYIRFKNTGLTTVFAWTLSDTLPNPEDFVLRRSQTTLEAIYRASEWESVHPQMPAPVTTDSGPVQPLSVRQYDDMPRNNPIAFRNNSPSSELKLNRRARKAEAARQRKIKRAGQKREKAMGTLQ